MGVNEYKDRHAYRAATKVHFDWHLDGDEWFMVIFMALIVLAFTF